jgi:predicted transcriptional regulator
MLVARTVSDVRRSKFEIIADMLTVLREPTCWTNIISNCNMSSRQSKQYLSLLMSHDLIQIAATARRVKKYQRTEAGRKLLEQYGKVVLLLEPSVSAASMIQ